MINLRIITKAINAIFSETYICLNYTRYEGHCNTCKQTVIKKIFTNSQKGQKQTNKKQYTCNGYTNLCKHLKMAINSNLCHNKVSLVCNI